MKNLHILLALLAVAGLIVASQAASALLYTVSGIDATQARPWTVWYYINDPVFKNRALLCLLAPHGILAFLFALPFLPKPGGEFGNAHWATGWDIRKAGLLKKNGLFLGKYKGNYLVSDSPTHVMLVAPTRSGKGAGLVVPNLLAWNGSIICLDVKQENYRITSGFRAAHGHQVFQWSPMDKDGRSHRYNPLDAVSKDPHQRISDLQVIAKILIKDPAKSDPVWASEARALFIGLALYVMDSKNMPTTIGAINRLLGTEQDLGDVCRHIVEEHPELSPTMHKSLMNFANKAAKERSGVKSSLNQAINLWDNPAIDAATSASDFSFSDLRKKKIAIYVGVQTAQISTLSPLLRIFFEQAITALTMREPDKDEPNKVLLLMDEFHMLGEVTAMTTAFTLLAGYGCRVMAVVQGLKWLDDVYGRDKRDGILSCCAHQVFFSANDLETANYVSQSCGTRTVKTVSTSQKGAWKMEPASKNTGYRPRPLISKDEALTLPAHEEIILVESFSPVRGRKIRYFEDKNFTQRLMLAPEVPKLKITPQAIPTFDIKPPPKTPNDPPTAGQVDLFTTVPKKVPPRLNDWLEELDDDEDAA